MSNLKQAHQTFTHAAIHTFQWMRWRNKNTKNPLIPFFNRERLLLQKMLKMCSLCNDAFLCSSNHAEVHLTEKQTLRYTWWIRWHFEYWPVVHLKSGDLCHKLCPSRSPTHKIACRQIQGKCVAHKPLLAIR